MKENELLNESFFFRKNFENIFDFDARILRSIKKVALENYKFLKNDIFITSISSGF